MVNKIDDKNELRERREFLANALQTMKIDYAGKNHGDSLLILGPLIDSLATASAAQVLKNGSQSLLFSLRIALQGIEIEKSSGGVIGKVLSDTTKGVVELINGIYLAKEDVGSREFFKLMAQALILTTISITWKLSQCNLVYGFVNESEDNDKGRKIFEFELILMMILKTGIIETLLTSLVEACGAPKNQQLEIAKFMKGLVLILILLTASKDDLAKLKLLTLDLKDDLIAGLQDLQIVINRAVESGKSGDKASSISIFIQQAIASLEDEDFDTLHSAYVSALEVIQANTKLMDQNIEEVSAFAETIYNAFTQGSMGLSRTTASLMI